MALNGNKNSDIEAGRRLGIKTYLVETGYGFKGKGATQATFIRKDLKEAVTHLLNSDES